MTQEAEKAQHPILQLEDEIAHCMFRISPSRNKDLEQFVTDSDLHIVFTYSKGFAIGVDVDTGEIELSISALNYLWCSTYLFFTLYNAYAAAQGSGPTSLDTSKEPVSTAIELFNWARQSLLSNDLEWPMGGPEPKQTSPVTRENPEPAVLDNIAVCDEIFLCALAWILHHERAHVELGHSALWSPDEVQEEADADASATQWVLDSCQNAKEREKRAYGIATATLSLVLLENPLVPQPRVSSHPASPERLRSNLQMANLPADSAVFSFCLVVLQFCIAQYADAPASDINEETFDKILLQFLDLYQSRHS